MLEGLRRDFLLQIFPLYPSVMEFLKVLDYRHWQSAFPRLKSYIKLSYPKAGFAEEHF